MREFMKQQPIRERLVRNDHVAERDCRHGGLVGEMTETQSSQHRIKVGIAHALALEYQQADVAEKLRGEEWCDRSTLLC